MVNIWTRIIHTMGYKRGINTCVECEKKMKANPDDTGMCPKCGKAQNRIESTVYKDLMDEGQFP
jgi:ssDNA-binding Zn-finger/Zn-ribbon topoisomerase 1